MRNRLAFAVSVSFIVAVAASAERVEPVFVREAVGMQSSAPAPRLADRDGLEPLVSLASASQAVPEEIDAIRQWNTEGRQPMKNGFTRSIGEPLLVRVDTAAFAAKGAVTGLVTTSESGTTIWSGSVRVEGAYRMRVHLKNVSVPPGTRFWVYGRSGQSTSFGTELIDPNRELYTPSIGGDITYLEMELPARSGNASFDIADVLELVGSQDPRPNDTPSCLVDGTCVTSSTLDVIDLYRKAVAHLQYVKGSGSFVCSGGLLNDTDTSGFIPYLLTANHCFSTQSSATSLEAFFDYKTSSCTGTFPNIDSFPKANGSTLLATGEGSDFTFLRLNSAPSGRVYLGWDSRTSVITAGTRLHRLSHPFPEAYSQPAPQSYSSTLINTTSSTCSSRPRGPYIYSTQSQGGIYGGSSGSPVILAGGIVVGQLFGQCGPSPSDGCNTANYAVDGALSTTYPSISTYLSGTTTAGCTPNSTTACMLNNRFRVTVRYRGGFDNGAADTTANVKSVTGFANPSFETAFFYFNSDSNIEMIVKILDQGNRNSQGQATIDVLTGSATPLRAEITIVDTEKNVTKTYTSNFGAQDGKTEFSAFVK